MFIRKPKHIQDISIGTRKPNTKDYIFCVIVGDNGDYIDDLKNIDSWEDYYFATVKGAKHRNGAKEILWRKHLRRVNNSAYQLDSVGNVVNNHYSF